MLHTTQIYVLNKTTERKLSLYITTSKRTKIVQLMGYIYTGMLIQKVKTIIELFEGF